MDATVQLGLVLAVATALTSVVGFLYKHRGAVAAPPVTFRRPLWSSVVLFRSLWYSLGIAIALGSWGLHVAALSLAPISLVQAVIAGGLVLLTVVADRFFAHSVTAREWIGVGLAAAGLAFLAATLGGEGDDAHSTYDPAVLTAYIGIALALGLAVAIAGRRGTRAGVTLAVGAGLLWTASDVSIKALSAQLGDGAAAVLLDPLAVVILVASLAGLLVSARSLQAGKAVPVIAVTSVTVNTLTIAAGSIVFEEPLPSNPVELALRVLAFAMVIGAAALTPAPVRAARMEPA